MSAGDTSIRDNDLLDMNDMVSVLPWLRPVLEEIQFLRESRVLPDTPEHLLVDGLPDDVEALQALLKRVGARYDGQED
jgi:hypothetical protein